MSFLLTYARTLPYLKPWQVAGRLVAPWRRRWTRLPAVPESLKPGGSPRTPFPSHDPWNTTPALRDGTFCFLNTPARLGRPVDWAAAGQSLLWRFNLHYFHYLHLLPPDEQVALCRDWIRHNPPGQGVGWHPYPTSLRLVNWVRAGVSAPDLLQSLYQQAAYLARNLETYVYGNHLLENARALVLAGAYLDGQGEAGRWLEQGLALYRRETREQILPDGGHFERSPMYHALMLEGYLDVLNVLPTAHPDRGWLEPVARRMGAALQAFIHPDGELALFNDATQEIAPRPAVLLDYLAALLGEVPAPAAVLPDTGYFVHRDAAVYLIVDGGAPGPSYLMAHAHADIFSYELSVQGVPFIVDAGVYEYPAGTMRQYTRSTAAHNTVSVDGYDQIECWGSFRVARRAAPRDVRFEAHASGCRFEGAFDGFTPFVGEPVTHHRVVTVIPATRQIAVADRITGTGRHRAVSRIRLHPDVVVSEGADGFVLERNGVSVRLEWSDETGWRWEEGWYCPRFGVRQRCRVLALEAEGALPQRIDYRLTY